MASICRKHWQIHQIKQTLQNLKSCSLQKINYMKDGFLFAKFWGFYSEVIKDSGLWHAMLCHWVWVSQHFEGTCHLHFQRTWSLESEGDLSLQNTENHYLRYVVSCAWKTDTFILSFLHLAFVLWTIYILQPM